MPGVVFGGSPTLQEVKEATSELPVALQKAYLSSLDSAGQDGSLEAGHYFGLSNSGLGSKMMDNEAIVTSETAVAPSVPANAIKAFRFLNDSLVTQVFSILWLPKDLFQSGFSGLGSSLAQINVYWLVL